MVEVLKMRPVDAIREFFYRYSRKPITSEEIRTLSKQERLELARECAKEMGVELEES